MTASPITLSRRRTGIHTKKLDPAQTEVIERIGVPDYIRFWWLRDGSPITSHDLSGKTNEDLEMDFNTMKQTWIFYDREEEVHFTRNGASYEVRDLPELIKLICDYGDPGEVKVHGMNNAGQLRETWIWIDHGLKVTLLDKVEVDRDYITATGAGTWLGK